MNYEEVQKALDIILADKNNRALDYAMAYAKEAKRMQGEELKLQLRYVLCNITSWRHEQAKFVRATFKSYAGIK